VFVAVLHSQRPLVEPELFSGEWETTTASGIHGIHLSLTTDASPQALSPQLIAIRIYHRQNGREKWGWWGDTNSVSPVFDGVRLHIGDLDVTFDSHLRRWTGAWFLDGESKKVVLEKPTCQSHPLCGVWQGRNPSGVVRLHVVQSTDGVLAARMDRSGFHGEHLRVVSSAPSGLTVETMAAAGLPLRFTGRLSNPSTLEGNWRAWSPGQDTRQTFHRVD